MKSTVQKSGEFSLVYRGKSKNACYTRTDNTRQTNKIQTNYVSTAPYMGRLKVVVGEWGAKFLEKRRWEEVFLQ